MGAEPGWSHAPRISEGQGARKKGGARELATELKTTSGCSRLLVSGSSGIANREVEIAVPRQNSCCPEIKDLRASRAA